MAPTPLQRFLAAVPPALIVGLVIAVAGGIPLDVYVTYLLESDRDPSKMRDALVGSNLLWNGVAIAVPVMVMVGLRELSRRLPAPDTVLVTIALVLLGLVVARTVGNVYVRHIATRPTWTADWYLWGTRLSCAAWFMVAIALVAAMARRRQSALVAVVAVALVLSSLMAYPTNLLYQWMHFEGANDGWVNTFIDALTTLTHATSIFAAVYLIADGAPAAPADPHRAAQGIARVGTALVARIVIAMGLAALTLLAFGLRSPGFLKLTLWAVPIAVLAATIAMVAGMVRAGGPSEPDAPRLRFTAAGALTLAATMMTAVQAIAIYRLTVDRMRGDDRLDSYARHSLETTATALPYFVPVLALVGLLCFIAGLASLKRRHGGVLGSAEPSAAAAMLVIFTAAAFGVQQWMAREPREVGTYLMLTIVTTVASIVAQLAVARLCDKISDGLMYQTSAGLPAARVYQSATDDLER